MGVSTGRGDTGYTSTLGGKQVPKHDLVIEASGALDEANSLVGMARATAKEKRTKRILLQVQRHLMIVGSELSAPKGSGKPLKKIISDTEVKWIETLIEDLEDALGLPPGFVTFGQEPSAAQMNVARTAVRKGERSVVRMNAEGLISNPLLITYLNRLSDLIFVLACFEEKSERERLKINKVLLQARLSDPAFRKTAILAGFTFLVLVAAIILLLVFHRPSPVQTKGTSEHMQEMRDMHKE